MKPEDKLLFSTTRQNFLELHQRTVDDLVRLNNINWEIIYATALNHGVAPLVYTNLRRCIARGLDAPQPILAQFQGCFFGNMAVKEQRARILADVLAYLDSRSIEVMLIKGTALDLLVYDHPYYTMSLDSDIVFRVRREAIPDEEHRQIADRLHDLKIEYDFFEHHDVVMNGVLPIDFQQIWDDATRVEFRRQGVWVMSPEDTLLSACINSCRKRFFRLKSLCDIAETINRYHDLNWEKLARRAKAFECENIVYTALLVTKMTLGCELPETIFQQLAINPVRRALIRALIRYLSHAMPLSALYPFADTNRFGREINRSLLLPYITYHWGQVHRKMRWVHL